MYVKTFVRCAGLVLAVQVGARTLPGAPAVCEVPLVVFDSPAACAGAAFSTWGGDRKGCAAYDSSDGALRLAWTNSVGAFGLGRAFDTAVTSALAATSGTVRHVRFTLSAAASSTQLHLRTVTDDGCYDQCVGLDPAAGVQTVAVRPGGHAQAKRAFNPHAIRRFLLSPAGGSGCVHVMSAALTIDTAVPPLPAPEVGLDDFRLFPAPRIFRAGDAVYDLAGYAVPTGCSRVVAWWTAEAARFWPRVRPRAGSRPLVFARADTPAGRAACARLGARKVLAHVKAGGYALAVRADGIDVLAPDDEGLMHGARVLMETVHLATGDAPVPRVRAVQIVDWPRVARRLFYLPLPPGETGGERLMPGHLADLLARFVYPARYNLVALDPGANYQYACDPGSGRAPGAWTPADLAAFVARVNAAGVRLVPFAMSPGHQWFHMFHGSRHMELSENGDVQTMCVRNPAAYELLFARMTEIAAACAPDPAMRADVFYTGGDEVRWRDRARDGSECTRCRAVPRNELLLEHAVRIDAWCRARGYQMLMCSDMYTPAHNGCNRFYGARVADRLPKTIGLVHWSSLDWDDVPRWRARGNDSWRVMTGYSDDPSGQDGLAGFGLAAYATRWWLSDSHEGGNGGYSPLAIAFAGSDGWGAPPGAVGTAHARAAVWGARLMRDWSRKPVPLGGTNFASVVCGTPAGACRVGGVPFSYRTDLAASNVWTLGRPAASLVFLHTATLPPAQRAAFRAPAYNRRWLFGAPIAEWEIVYTDGSTACFPVRFGWEVGEGAPPDDPARVPWERYIGDARGVWTAPSGRTLWAHEWVNPYPARTIATVMRRVPADTPVAYDAWALTARDLAGDVFDRYTPLVRAVAASTNAVPRVAELPPILHRRRAGRNWWWARALAARARADELVRTRGGRLDVLMIGDSITHHWEDTGAAFYAEITSGRAVINLANGGDDAANQDWLVTSGLLDGLDAKLVSILIGTNDAHGTEESFRRIARLVSHVRERLPRARIVLTALLPQLADKAARTRALDAETNRRLASLADGRHVVFLDVGAPMRATLNLPEAGRRAVAPDLLHPAPAMYRHWLACLAPYLPPPEGDLAPPRHVRAFALARRRAKGAVASGELDAHLRAALAATPGARNIYLRYRTSCATLTGKLLTVTADDTYHSDIGFIPDGAVHDAVIRLEGWSRTGLPLAIDARTRFIFRLGDGEIELLEAGVREAPFE